MKTVEKPWGRELWLELNEHYCYKRIFLRAGSRTSLQRHRQKVETNYVVEGKGVLLLEHRDGGFVEQLLGPGDVFTIRPPRAHRVTASTDLVLQEVSTPEVDDVIRLEDDAGRPNGRIDSEHR
jgi:mannose-6-phosphate isomerase